MSRFLLRRLIFIPLVLALANFAGFAFAFTVAPVVMTQNPYASAAGDLPPLLSTYADYLRGALRGDFGETFNGQPVFEALARFGTASLGLLAISLTLSVVLGIFLGRLSVRRSRSGVAPWLTFVSAIGLAAPSFYTAALLIAFFLLFFLYVGSSSTPLIPFTGFGWDAHLILPTLALTVQPTVKLARVTGGLLAEELEKQYVTASLSFGFSFETVKKKLAFRSVLAPILLTVAASLRLMIAELIVIERLFNWPGVGRLISNVLSRNSTSGDFLSAPMSAALLTALAAVFLLTDLLATFAAQWVDPRLRADMDVERTKGAA